MILWIIFCSFFLLKSFGQKGARANLSGKAHCERCNYFFGQVENSGLLQHYTTPAYQLAPLNTSQQEIVDWLRWQCDDWLERHRDSILLYMRQERWLPRKDILFHLANNER